MIDWKAVRESIEKMLNRKYKIVTFTIRPVNQVTNVTCTSSRDNCTMTCKE